MYFQIYRVIINPKYISISLRLTYNLLLEIKQVYAHICLSKFCDSLYLGEASHQIAETDPSWDRGIARHSSIVIYICNTSRRFHPE